MEYHDWEPQVDVIQELVQIFASSRSGSNEVQREVYQKIEQYSQNDEYVNYLSLILSLASDVTTEVRQIAGLTLKSHLRANFPRIPMSNIEYCKGNLLTAFYDQEESIRKTVSNVISTVIVKGGLNLWPDIIEFLVNNLAYNDESVVDNAMQALSLIVDDTSKLFEDENYSKYLKIMLEPIFALAANAKGESVKANAIGTMNMLLLTLAPCIMQSTEDYLLLLVQNAAHSSLQVRHKVLQGLTNIMELRLEHVVKHDEKVYEVMLRGLGEKD